MVILPTEKRFDWQHVPLVLMALVFFNLAVFFFYQIGDERKLEEVYDLYQAGELFSIEWPLYHDYLNSVGKGEIAEELLYHIGEGFEADISYLILSDVGFNRYLSENFRDLVPDAQYARWSATRPLINPIIESISTFRLGLVPDRLSIIDVFAYQFLHGDIMHLLGNMFFLLVCGFAVEAAIGHWRFLAFYLVAGIVAGLSHALVDLNSSDPLIGASGSISGVMAMYLGVFRLRKIEFFYWFFIFVGYFRAPALLMLPIYVGKELFDFISSDGDNVAYMAHAGGFVAGALMIGISLKLHPQTINAEYVEKDQTDDNYQEKNEYQEKLDIVFKALESFQFAAALKAVNAMIKEYGIDFQLAAIRYNLAKIKKPEGYRQWVTELLNQKTRDRNELAKMQMAWQENPDISQQIDDNQALDLAFRFSNKEQFLTAEAIFKRIHDKKPLDPQLPLLAHKLAEVAHNLHEPKKHKVYLQFAKTGPSALGA